MDLPERLIYVACLVSLTVLAFWGAGAVYQDLDSAGIAVVALALMLALFVAPLAFEWRREAIKRKSFAEGWAAGLAEAERRRQDAEAEERDREQVRSSGI